jgi:hypothetical protein
MYWEYCVEDTAISSFLVTRFQVEGRNFLVTCHLELCDLWSRWRTDTLFSVRYMKYTRWGPSITKAHLSLSCVAQDGL